ncbi:MAG: alanine dehydrogenase [Rhodospirillales bacterium]|nr:alanine dehydrogenase [Rhodospirillales bacterium]
MDIGIAREIKAQEGRVALMPTDVASLVGAGHQVQIETNAGLASGADDAAYTSAGARIAASAEALYGASQMIVKVKEIMPEEYGFLRSDQIIYTNLHTALNRHLTDQLLALKVASVSAENTHEDGSPNCPLAGEIGAFEGVRLCLAPHGGTGRHFMEHFGAAPLKAIVIGLGAVGQGSLRTLLRLGCSVTGLDIVARARKSTQLTWASHAYRSDHVASLASHLGDADLIVNCVLWPKHRKDHLISRAMLAQLKPTAAIVDISCDTAGAIETCRPTTWAEPVYTVDGIRHFCVDNIPGAAPATASAGYSRAILPFVARIANEGLVAACKAEPWLARGLTTHNGTLTLSETAQVQDRAFTPAEIYLEQLTGQPG